MQPHSIYQFISKPHLYKPSKVNFSDFWQPLKRKKNHRHIKNCPSSPPSGWQAKSFLMCLNPRRMHKNMSEKNGARRHNRRLYYQSRAKVWPINLTSFWKTTCQMLTKKKCASAVSHSQRTSQRYMISYNAQFVICSGKEGVRKRRGLWKGKWEGGFVSIFPTVGIGNKQMLSITNRLPSFSNEEVKGWRVGCKWGTDEQQAPSNRPVCVLA